MEFLHFLSFLSLAMVLSHAHADVAPETYWKSVLPNTPIPKAFTHLLYNDESTDVDDVGVGKSGVSVHHHFHPPPHHHHPPHHPVPETPKKDCNKVKIGDGIVFIRCRKPIKIELSPFSYKYLLPKDQLNDNPNVALFFLENSLHQGNVMNLQFAKTSSSSSSTFLPQKVADMIPFSSNNLPQLHTQFSIEPDSIESESMKQTIRECEDKAMEGEKKYCATSLEAMVDFSIAELGTKIKAISTEVLNARKGSPLQKYTIEGAKNVASKKVVVCHEQNYMYAVFYCHKTTTTKAYTVSLVGEDGTKANVVAVCHIDTAKWNPKHLAFKVLKVKPGTTPVCHFLPEDHVVWVPYNHKYI